MLSKPLTAALALALATTFLAPMAQARGEGQGPRLPAFETLDTNKDGKIDQAEAKAMLQTRMTTADTNSDGTITLEELQAHMSARASKRAQENASRMMERLDTDKDGKISTAELTAMAERQEDRFGRIFSRLDRDDDGAISQTEYDRMAERMQKRGEGRSEHRGGWFHKN